jgi:hypothetical protein
MGVLVPSGIEVPVSEGTAVMGRVGVDVWVREGVAVAVGDGIRIGVAVDTSDDNVSVGEGRGRSVEVNGLEDVSVGEGNGNKVGVNESDAVVAMGDGNGIDVRVSESDGDVAVREGSGGAVVAVTGCVSVRKICVLVGVPACGVFAGIHKTRQINNIKSRRATTSLNRS